MPKLAIKDTVQSAPSPSPPAAAPMTDPKAHLNAVLQGRYRIEREIGEGGMATVYLAEDLKHHRKVALKVLKPKLAAVVGPDRFLAEIETTANLQHPHILPLYDSGRVEAGAREDASSGAGTGFVYFVMPYVEGESLRDRLDRETQLPVDEAVEIAQKVAGALDYAHDHGVIHRDIKPANILLHGGEPVVADFGIALAVGTAGGGRLTETGLSLGSPHYMSPEQATGDQGVGPAADIYALGCVLYEMLVGEPPYTGATAQAVLGKIVTEEPERVTDRRRSVPPNVDATIRKALEKVPADRFGRAAVFARALDDPAFRYGDEAPGPVKSLRGQWTPVAIFATGLSILLGLALVLSLLRPEPSASVARLTVSLPEGVQLPSQAPVAVAVAPDGSSIVFQGVSAEGVERLWQRPLDALSATPIPGTDGGRGPRFSPDGRSIVFGVDGPPRTLRVVSLVDGTSRILLSGEMAGRQSFAWGTDGMIYYGNDEDGISRIPASGGQPEVITVPESGEDYHGLTDVLPNGEGVLFHTRAGSPIDDSIAVASVETGEYHTLFPGSKALYAASGHLVYGSRDGRLFAVPFDPQRLEVTGAPRIVAEGVEVTDVAPSLFALSDAGVLVYSQGEAGTLFYATELVWVSRSGAITPIDSNHRFIPSLGNPGWTIAPGGRRVALSHYENGNWDIWVKQLPEGPFERLTTNPGPDWSPTWSPDGRYVTYAGGVDSLGVESFAIWQRRADGTGERELVIDDDRGYFQPDWSPDGEWILFRTATEEVRMGERDIWAFRPGMDSVATPLIASEDFVESGPAISPDGDWIAYSSNISGREQVYVRPFPDTQTGRVTVSVDGGWNPQWGHQGNELFFVAGDRALMAAEFEVDPEFRVLNREVLFEFDDQLFVPSDPEDDIYDVAPDDQKFLMASDPRSALEEGRSELVVVLNFFEELQDEE